MNLGFLGHVNDDVGPDLGLATQATSVDQATLGLVPLLDLVPVRERAFGDRDPVLRELAIAGSDLALRTDAPSTADGIEIDAQRTGGFQHRRTHREPPTLARRREYDQRVFGVAHGIFRSPWFRSGLNPKLPNATCLIPLRHLPASWRHFS